MDFYDDIITMMHELPLKGYLRIVYLAEEREVEIHISKISTLFQAQPLGLRGRPALILKRKDYYKQNDKEMSQKNKKLLIEKIKTFLYQRLPHISDICDRYLRDNDYEFNDKHFSNYVKDVYQIALMQSDMDIIKINMAKVIKKYNEGEYGYNLAKRINIIFKDVNIWRNAKFIEIDNYNYKIKM